MAASVSGRPVGSMVAAVLVGVLVTTLAGCGGSGGTQAEAERSPTGHHRHQPSSAPAHERAGSATEAAPLRAGERFRTLSLPGGPYQPSAPAAGQDDYRCFLIDPGLTSDAFLTGATVLPGQPAIVHHAILFRVAPGQVAAVRRHDAAASGRGWTCFGDAGIPRSANAVAASDPVASLDSAPWLAAWAPGGGESVFGAGTGVHLDAGSQIVLQVHYNLRELDQANGPDDTRVRLRLAPGSSRLRPLRTMLLVAPVELPCTPAEHGPLCDRGMALLNLSARFGEEAGRTVAGLQLLCGGNVVSPRAGPVQHCDRTVPRTMVVRAVAGHMHLLGRSITISLDPGSPHQRTLLDRPVWDFDNQRATPLPRPVRVRRGETLRVTCRHDAALRSMVPELSQEQPRYVTWGEGTADEMCLGIVLYTRN